MKKKNEVVKRNDKTEVSTQVIDLRADAGKGLEGADKDSFAIPMVNILQALSPQVAEKTVKGAESGMFINTLTNELYDELIFIPCSFRRRYLQWERRENGGGFKGFHSVADVDSGKLEIYWDDKDGKLCLGNDILNDTREHFIMVQSASGRWSPALMSLAVTQVKKSKNLMALILGIEKEDDVDKVVYNPPSFANVFKATTALEKNDKGTWYGVNFEYFVEVEDPILYQKCRKFNQQINEGRVETETPASDVKEAL